MDTAALMDRYLDIISTDVPEHWAHKDGQALLMLLYTTKLENANLSLQQVLHDQIQKKYQRDLESLLPQQPPVVQHIYASVKHSKSGAMAALMAIPKDLHTIFTSAEMKINFCRAFALPFPHIPEGARCPGKKCKESLDRYGIHLLNCKHISVPRSEFSKQSLHSHIGQVFCQILERCHQKVILDPSSASDRPRLRKKNKPPDKDTLGRLDIAYLQRIQQGGAQVLGDITCVNPVNANTFRNILTSPMTHIIAARNKKINKYNEPIMNQLQGRVFVPFVVDSYGFLSEEVTKELQIVADHCQEISDEPDVLSSELYIRFLQSMACAIHKGVARVLLGRLQICQDMRSKRRVGYGPPSHISLHELVSDIMESRSFSSIAHASF